MYDRDPMVGSVRTCPFLGKFPLAQSIGPVLCFAQWLDVPDLGGGSLSLCLSAEALVHVAEANSIVAEATTLISIYTSECHLLAPTTVNKYQMLCVLRVRVSRNPGYSRSLIQAHTDL